jgi:FAD/FMN-containing dehydrogenase
MGHEGHANAEGEASLTENLSGWGRVPIVRARQVRSEDLTAVTRDAVLSRGLGRSYGDASLPPPPATGEPAALVACTTLADRILSFDGENGTIRAEAGLSLRDLHRVFLPRGWYTPVVPGTQYVTLGGMVAADVHGKNHHRNGSFGEHVEVLRIRVGNGRVLEITSESEPELFRATLGGMGLTGHILDVGFRLERIPSPWIVEESERLPDLESVINGLREASARWPFTMAWVDTIARGRSLGRGIVYRGRWAEPSEAPAEPFRPHRRLGVPLTLPGGLVNRVSIGAANTAWFRNHPRRFRRGIRNSESFFYPLDMLLAWNRLYGRHGPVQYQCVLPGEAQLDSLRDLLGILRARGTASFLTVLKDFGAEGRGMLSFPRPGLSINFDLPMRGAKTRALVDALNGVVAGAGGRIYLAKDALTRPEHFRRMEPRLAVWNEVRRKWDPDRHLRSALSRRLLGDPP